MASEKRKQIKEDKKKRILKEVKERQGYSKYALKKYGPHEEGK